MVRQKILTNFAQMTRWNINTINNYYHTEMNWQTLSQHYLKWILINHITDVKAKTTMQYYQLDTELQILDEKILNPYLVGGNKILFSLKQKYNPCTKGGKKYIAEYRNSPQT